MRFLPAINENIAATTGKNLNNPNFKNTLIAPVAAAKVTKIVPVVITPCVVFTKSKLRLILRFLKLMKRF